MLLSNLAGAQNYEPTEFKIVETLVELEIVSGEEKKKKIIKFSKSVHTDPDLVTDEAYLGYKIHNESSWKRHYYLAIRCPDVSGCLSLPIQYAIMLNNAFKLMLAHTNHATF